MKEKKTNNYPPNALLMILYRLPVYFYKIGLGWMFGKRFVLFHHIGRKSGKRFQTVVEVVEIEKETGNVVIVAGYGDQTQWYKNLKKLRNITIQIGNQKISVSIELISPEDGENIIARYFDRYGRITGKLFSILGYEWDGTEKGARQIAMDHLRFVRFLR